MPGLLRLSVFGVVFSVLSGCLPEGVPVRVSPPGAGDAPLCAPGVYAGLVGEPASAAKHVPQPRRILRPGEAATTDYDPRRTNVELDEADVIVRVFCG